jgi:hypothetical protein
MKDLWVPADYKALSEEAAESNAAMLEVLTERMAELELALEDEGWVRLSMASDLEFSLAGLQTIRKLARVMYLKNPLIQRGVNVQTYYVFGQGMNVRAKDTEVNEVVQSFLNDSKNKAELTSHQARMEKETDLQLESNIFFTFFTTPGNGRVRVRTIPVDEVTEIIKNPEDSREPWYYKRVWTQSSLEITTGGTRIETKTAYYPDWRYQPTGDAKPKKIGDADVMWDNPVYHVRTGGLSRMSFGVSEVYAAIDWARAYKDFLENWSTIVQAYARFAWKASGAKSSAAVAAVKSKFQSTLPATGTEKNPPPTVASMLVEPGSLKMEPMRTAGATTDAEDGRRLLLMVAMVFGAPETFFGDASVGTLATAKSLDRPTELKMVSRQTLWADVYRDILDYVLVQAVKYGTLKGTIDEEDDGTPQIQLTSGDPTVIVTFPPILEHDVEATVRAIAQAATLNGQALAGTIELQDLARMLLNALGEEDTDAMLERMFPEEESAAENKLAAAVKGLQEVIEEARDKKVSA